MHDPVLKSVFADRDMIEILTRDRVPEWAGAIDFSTLREEPTELVSKKTLQRRQALRTTTYAALGTQGWARSWPIE